VRTELIYAGRPKERDGLMDGWTDGQTDMTKVVVAFRNFANALTNDMKAEYLFGVLTFFFSFRYFHIQFSVILSPPPASSSSSSS